MPSFIPGLELNRRFYLEAVKPILDLDFAQLQFAAARLGTGSEVLGYDTPMSTDHDWGPRLQLFLPPEEFAAQHEAVRERLSQRLPKHFLGYSTNFSDPDDGGSRLLADTHGPVNHRVEIWTVPDFFINYMAYDPREEVTVLDWLIWPQQHLLGVTAGAIYEDALGELTLIRQRLHYYPHDVWLYLLAAQWSRIGQEEHLAGRAAYTGDELGSRLLAGRLVHDIMQLCYLMERTYAPYPKWFGTAFTKLACATQLTPILTKVLSAEDWPVRESFLCQAYEYAAEVHNSLGLTEHLDPRVRSFHKRPFQVIDAGRFSVALKEQIGDPTVRAISSDIGSIDQFSHSTDLRSYSRLHKRLQSLYK